MLSNFILSNEVGLYTSNYSSELDLPNEQPQSQSPLGTTFSQEV